MALVKNTQSNRLMKEAIVLDMGDLGLHAQRIVKAAHEQAARIIEEAKAHAKRLTDNASEAGFAEGSAQGLQEGRVTGHSEGRESALAEFRLRLNEVAQAWSAALANWETQRTTMIHEARENVVRFAVEVAKKVVHRTIERDFTIVQDQVAHALMTLGQSTAVDIVINSADRTFVEEIWPALVADFASCQNASIRVDDSMMQAGCVVTTRGGHIDATIETQMERIAAAICGEERGPEPDALAS